MVVKLKVLFGLNQKFDFKLLLSEFKIIDNHILLKIARNLLKVGLLKVQRGAFQLKVNLPVSDSLSIYAGNVLLVKRIKHLYDLLFAGMLESKTSSTNIHHHFVFFSLNF